MNKAMLTNTVISAVGGALIGGAITYVTVNKALRTRYEDWANEEIDSVKARYAAMNADRKQSFIEMATNPSPEILAAVEAGKRLIEQQGYVSAEDGTMMLPEAQQETLSIFDQGVDVDDEGNVKESEDEDDEEPDDEPEEGYEIKDDEPYLIREAEYFENEPGYELDTLTYYDFDNVLTDEKNERIDNVDGTVGLANLHRFPPKRGQDKVSIYVRNDEHLSFYEVILVEASYGATILGVDPEDLGEKPPKKRPKKMREDVEA